MRLITPRFNLSRISFAELVKFKEDLLNEKLISKMDYGVISNFLNQIINAKKKRET